MVADTDTHSEALLTFDWSDEEELCSDITSAIAAISGDDPLAMEPLGSVIDLSALTTLFAPTRDPMNSIRGYADFEYEGYRVVIKANGRGFIFASEDDVIMGAGAHSWPSMQADD